MKIILDTANLVEIRKWAPLLGVTHITTNPHLLKSEGIDSNEKFNTFILELEKIIPDVEIFFQCFSTGDIDNLVHIKKNLDTKSDINYIAKVTMYPKYYPLITYATKQGLEVAATTCYDLVQIHQACEFKIDYSMVYFAKNENITLLDDVVKMGQDYGSSTIFVAASFRTKKDFITAIKSGIDSATVPPAVLESVYHNNNVEADILKVFDKDSMSLLEE